MVLVLFGAPAFAGPRAERKITIPDVTAAERALFEDARDDKLDTHDPVTAALAGSSASPKEREAAAARWQNFLAGLQKLGKDKSARDKAQLVLAELHKQLLTRYDFFQNDMSKVLADGSYNCVTSAIAFQAAGAALGLDVRGVLVPSHVYVRVVADGVSYDVETTSPSGFLLAQDDEAYKKFLEKMQLDTEKKVGRKITSSKAEFSRRETDPIGLVALLYANRGAFAVERGKQKEAIGQFARSALLAEDERYARDSRDLLLAQAAEKQIQDGDLDEARSLLRFAIKDPGGDPVVRRRLSENIGYTWELEAQGHLDAKRWESAFSCLIAAREWHDDPAIPHNMKATLNMWGIEELDAKRFEQAADVFYRAMTSFPEDTDFGQNLKAVYSGWTSSLLAKKEYDAAMQRSRRLLALLPKDPQAPEIFAHAASLYGESLALKGEWAAAVPLLEDACKTAPGVAYLREDLVVALTNAGVSWAKAGEKEKASAAWRRAIQLDPNAAAAKTNLDRLSKN